MDGDRVHGYTRGGFAVCWRFESAFRGLVVLGGMLGLVLSGTAEAATLTICPSGCDAISFQAAADAAAPGDTIRLLSTLPHGEVGIEIHKDLTIEGVNEFQSIVRGNSLPGVANDRLFNIFPGHRVTIRDLRMINGRAQGEKGGAIWIQSSSDPNALVTIERAVINANEAESGGGIYAGAPLVLRDVTVNSNTADGGDGGGIYAEQTLDMRENIRLQGNSASVRGGGLCVIHPSDPSLLDTTILDAMISGQAGEGGEGGLGGAGGGIFNTGKMRIGGGSEVLQGEAFVGSGIYHEGPHLLTVENTLFALNRSDDGSGPPFTIRGGGGGIYLDGPADIRDTDMFINSADPPLGGQFGGALLIEEGASAAVRRTRFAENSAVTGGGAIAVYGDLDLEHSSLYDNAASIGGGIFVAATGAARVTNTTIADNETGSSGGGAFNAGELRLASSTVAFNHNIGGQGGGLHRGSTATTHSIRSSIVAANTSGAFGSHPDCFGTFNASSFSLIGDTGPSGAICAVSGFTSGMIYNASPQFATSLVVDGYASRYQLLSSSPAIDEGACASAGGGPVIFDQRYAGRPVDGDGSSTDECDMGAYEYLPEPGFSVSLAMGLWAAVGLRRSRAPSRAIP